MISQAHLGEHKKAGAARLDTPGWFGKTLNGIIEFHRVPMPDPQTRCIYQFKVVLRGISPMIWRRLLLRSDHSTKKPGRGY